MSKDDLNQGYLAFMPDWRVYRSLLSMEEWYELENYIFQLRFDGVDTDPSTIKNVQIKAFWGIIRKGILKAMRQFRYRQGKKNKANNQDISSNTDFDADPKISDSKAQNPVNDITPQPTQESLSNKQETGENEIIEMLVNEGYSMDTPPDIENQTGYLIVSERTGKPIGDLMLLHNKIYKKNKELKVA